MTKMVKQILQGDELPTIKDMNLFIITLKKLWQVSNVYLWYWTWEVFSGQEESLN